MGELELKLQARLWAITSNVHDYVIGDEFEFSTHSNPLVRVMKSKRTVTDRSKLSVVSLKSCIKNGKSNRNTDALSSYPVESYSEDDHVNISN